MEDQMDVMLESEMQESAESELYMEMDTELESFADQSLELDSEQQIEEEMTSDNGVKIDRKVVVDQNSRLEVDVEEEAIRMH